MGKAAFLAQRYPGPLYFLGCLVVQENELHPIGNSFLHYEYQ
jgi:hypothetical protein